MDHTMLAQALTLNFVLIGTVWALFGFVAALLFVLGCFTVVMACVAVECKDEAYKETTA